MRLRLLHTRRQDLVDTLPPPPITHLRHLAVDTLIPPLLQIMAAHHLLILLMALNPLLAHTTTHHHHHLQIITTPNLPDTILRHQYRRSRHTHNHLHHHMIRIKRDNKATVGRDRAGIIDLLFLLLLIQDDRFSTNRVQDRGRGSIDPLHLLKVDRAVVKLGIY